MSRDILQPVVEALGQDVQDPAFHHRKWVEMYARDPSLANFIGWRATALFGADKEGVSKALALVVEVQTISDKVEFGRRMGPVVPIDVEALLVEASGSEEPTQADFGSVPPDYPGGDSGYAA